MTLEKQIQSKRAYTQVYEIFTINLIKEISICTVFTIGELLHHKIDEKWQAKTREWGAK
jgi:hypothetical protein